MVLVTLVLLCWSCWTWWGIWLWLRDICCCNWIWTCFNCICSCCCCCESCGSVCWFDCKFDCCWSCEAWLDVDSIWLEFRSSSDFISFVVRVAASFESSVWSLLYLSWSFLVSPDPIWSMSCWTLPFEDNWLLLLVILLFSLALIDVFSTTY